MPELRVCARGSQGPEPGPAEDRQILVHLSCNGKAPALVPQGWVSPVAENGLPHPLIVCPIRVDGQIQGKLLSDKGTVIIGENAVIDADVQVGVAIVRGKVNGRIEASQRIEIYAPAQVVGDIRAPTITIDSGVIFNGKCEMQQGAKAFDPKSKAVPKPVEKPSEKAAS